MRIGVMSDTHGGLDCWEEIMGGVFGDVDLILHAGDIFYHGIRNPLPQGYNTQALAETINGTKTPLLLCRGNCDSEVDQLVIDLPIQAPYLLCQFDRLRILVHHGHLFSEKEVLRLVSRWNVAVCVSGHTHIPRLEEEENAIFLNPGSPALPKEGNPPTVAIIDMDHATAHRANITLHDYQNNNIIKSFSFTA